MTSPSLWPEVGQLDGRSYVSKLSRVDDSAQTAKLFYCSTNGCPFARNCSDLGHLLLVVLKKGSKPKREQCDLESCLHLVLQIWLCLSLCVAACCHYVGQCEGANECVYDRQCKGALRPTVRL